MTNAQIELEKKKREAAEKLRLAAAAKKAHLVARSDYTLKEVNPFGPNNERIPLRYGMSRDGRQYSEKQLKILRDCGCDPNRYPYKQGQAIIAAKIAKWRKERVLS